MATHTARLRAALTLPLVLSLGACLGTSLEEGQGAVENDFADGFRLVQQGAFRDQGRVIPRVIDLAFVSERGAAWENQTQVTVSYTDGLNDEVWVGLPPGTSTPLLAYRIHFETPGDDRGVTTEDRYVHLSSPGGTIVQLPVWNDPSYPYLDACYMAAVQNATDGIGTTNLPGKVKRVFYAYTFQPVEQYLWDESTISWWNGSGEPVAEGILDAHHEPDAMGSRRGMYPLFVRVPVGMSLVFRIETEGFEGQCMTPAAPATSLGTSESQLFFMPRSAIEPTVAAE